MYGQPGTVLTNVSRQCNLLFVLSFSADSIHGIIFPQLIDCILLSSSLTIYSCTLYIYTYFCDTVMRQMQVQVSSEVINIKRPSASLSRTSDSYLVIIE